MRAVSGAATYGKIGFCGAGHELALDSTESPVDEEAIAGAWVDQDVPDANIVMQNLRAFPSLVVS